MGQVGASVRTAHSSTDVPRVGNLATRQPNVMLGTPVLPDQSQHHSPKSLLHVLANTPIKLESLSTHLRNYPNRIERDELLNGFTHGFRLGYTGPRQPRESPCLKSALDNPLIVRNKLFRERALGRIAGPFSSMPLSNLQCSPIGLVPKKQPGEFRVIHHLSFPAGASINDFIDDKLCRVRYASFDDAVHMIDELSRVGDVFMAKLDIKSAFRLLPISPLDFDLLGFKFQGDYWVDRCLPMGCAISCRLFEMFSSFLEFHVKKVTGSDQITHYLDDFCLASSSRADCDRAMTQFQDACDDLGVPIAHEKTEGPVQVLEYLGLEIDSVRKQVRVPRDKLDKTIKALDMAIRSRKMTLLQIQSLIGSLSFLCKAIHPGRTFLRRLIGLTCGVKKSYYKIRITMEVKLDLLMWNTFLTQFNGVTFFQEKDWICDDSINLFTDSAGSIGFGLYFRGRWAQGRWPDWVMDLKLSIAALELFPIFVAIRIWGKEMAGMKVVFSSDNKATVAIINKKTSPCSTIMKMVRGIVLTCLTLNISIKSEYIEGRNNCIADFLSRFQMDAFRRVAPEAERTGEMVPLTIWDVFM